MIGQLKGPSLLVMQTASITSVCGGLAEADFMF